MKLFIAFLFLVISISLGCSNQNNFSKENESSDEFHYIKHILEDGQGDFDPWNTNRWADWYNADGELIRPFDIDTSITLKSKNDPWVVRFSEQYTYSEMFIIAQQGIMIDGNGITLDVRTEKQSLPLEELYALRKEPWNEGNEIRCIFSNLPEKEGVPATRVSNFTFMGWKRGIKVNGTGNEEAHRLIIENCVFTRNRVGFYTNGYNTLLKNCWFYENGYGAIYSGSQSRRNQIIDNTFRDNNLSQHQHSYGDFIGDTFFDSEISYNEFLKSELKSESRRIGISLFRNMGESNNLREQMPHNNVIRGNHFDGYSVAINVGARMGRGTRNDITGEGRDYAFYNLLDSNRIENTAIGIKVNTAGNTISNNTFDNVKEDIVLHCVFFKLENTTINHQPGDKVKLWYVSDDYSAYIDWFKFQDDLNGSIKKEEKMITVFSQVGSPDYPNMGPLFKVNPTFKTGNKLLNDYRAGAPIGIDTGEFSLDLPAKEFIAIWDQPISRVDDKDYFSILFFDDKGTEINRCGRSEIKWKQIAAGYFISKEGEMEVAATPASPIDGKYPVFIFDRGFRIPKDTLYQDNENPDIMISATASNELVVNLP